MLQMRIRLSNILRTAGQMAVVAAAVGWAVNWVGVAAQATAADDAKRPNILMIYCDDHAYQAISAYQSISPYGLDLNQTPHIDRLAKEGMRFDNCAPVPQKRNL